MDSQPLLYIANWKMNMGAKQASEWIDQCKEWVKKHPQLERRIVVCPSFPFLLPLKIELAESNIYMGAQNCSEHEHGAYTGQVAAQDLVDVGADFCLIGHSECRQYLNESSETVANKVKQLFSCLINPIICIGETADQYNQHQTLEALEAQLEPIIKAINTASSWPNILTIAYEPVWAIGTGKIPNLDELQTTFAWINSYLSTKVPTIKTIRILYGGSVDATNASSLATIKELQGFLIGGASLDFQKFKNIVGLE